MASQTIERYVLRGVVRDLPITVTERTDTSTGWMPTRNYHVASGTRSRVFKTMRGAIMWGRAALRDASATLERI